jgi:hypothetical protein
MTRPEPENRQRRGTVFIVDISGYSKFVMSTEPADGAYIMEVLLEALLPEITPQFKVSEIEGDAVLFYRLDDPVPVHTILAQFQSMLDRFEQKVAILACSFPQVTPLTIKLVVHYGTVLEYMVAGFRKLYGIAVVEAHRLLKNHVGCDTYALITEAYFNEQAGSGTAFPDTGSAMYDIYDVGKVSYVYYKYPFG